MLSCIRCGDEAEYTVNGKCMDCHLHVEPAPVHDPLSRCEHAELYGLPTTTLWGDVYELFEE